MDNTKIAAELTNSLEKILKFAGCEEELAGSFRDSVTAYKKLPTKMTMLLWRHSFGAKLRICFIRSMRRPCG